MVCIHYASIPPLPLHIYDVIPHFFQISILCMFILLICNKWVLKCTQTFVYKLPYVRRRHCSKVTWYFMAMKSVLYCSSFDKNWVNVKSLDLQIRNYKTFEVPSDLSRVKKKSAHWDIQHACVPLLFLSNWTSSDSKWTIQSKVLLLA